jgi:hypothetical protein
MSAKPDPDEREEVTYLALSVGERDVDEAAGVEIALVRAALGCLLLLLFLDLLCFRFRQFTAPLCRGGGRVCRVLEPWESAT